MAGDAVLEADEFSSPGSGCEISFRDEVDETLYCNIAPGKTCAQSSLSRFSRPDGAAALVAETVAPDFAIHTEKQRSPWWSIDLGAPLRDVILVLYNRATKDNAKGENLRRRALPLMVQISEDGAAWSTIADIDHEFGDLHSGQPLRIRIVVPPAQAALRHLRFMVRSRHAALHLQSLKVYARRDAAPAMTEAPVVSLPTPSTLQRLHDLADLRMESDTARIRYERDGLDFRMARPDAGIGAVAVLPFARLGNRIACAVNGILFAKHRGIRQVYLDFGPLAAELDMPESFAFGDITISLRPPDPEKAENVMASRFFYGRYLPNPLHQSADLYPIMLQHVARRIFLPTMEPGIAGSETVTIHIRSGDLFRAEGAGGHKGYVQPPLAYYTACLEHAAAQRPFTRVQLVYEDDRNPVVAALRAHCASARIACLTQSGALRADVAAIFGARRLIAGHGTFAPAIAAQSNRLEAIYFFRRPHLPHFFDRRAVEIFVAADTAGAFTAYGDWANTAAQRQLMLDYPAGNLAIAPHP